MSKSELEKIYGKPYINQDLIDAVAVTMDNSKLNDDSFKVWERADEFSIKEKRYWSELGRSIEQFTKEEFAVVTYTAILNYPEMVFQLLLEEYLNNLNNKERNSNNEDSKDV